MSKQSTVERIQMQTIDECIKRAQARKRPLGNVVWPEDVAYNYAVDAIVNALLDYRNEK
jgi:hypothetical protein